MLNTCLHVIRVFFLKKRYALLSVCVYAFFKVNEYCCRWARYHLWPQGILLRGLYSVDTDINNIVVGVDLQEGETG